MLRCIRCNCDLGPYWTPYELDPSQICNACSKVKYHEWRVSKWRDAPTPTYDIDQILAGCSRGPHEVIHDLNSRIDADCPEERLLTPELVVRDFARFKEFEGHDLGYVLASGGIKVFSHGLRAMRTVGISPMTEYLEAFKQCAVKLGIPFPEHMPDPWIDEYEIDYDIEQQLNQASEELYDEYKPYAGMTAGGLNVRVVNYLVDHISCLRTRRPQHGYPS